MHRSIEEQNFRIENPKKSPPPEVDEDGDYLIVGDVDLEAMTDEEMETALQEEF